MMAFRGLTLNGNYFWKEWIADHYSALDEKAYTPQELRTLSLCGRWVSGENRFRIMTSGSTGKPKFISIQRGQMETSARMTAEALNLEPGDRALVCLSAEYIGGLMMLVRGLVLGLELFVVEPRENPLQGNHLKISSVNSSPRFDFASFVPLQMQAILESDCDHKPLLDGMKAILVGGSRVSHSLMRAVQEIKAPVFQTFGMTETVSHIALRRLNGPDASQSYKTLPGVELGQDERGCLTVRSDVTGNRVVVTNDLVEVQSPEEFVWLGRVDNVINTGGIKVHPEPVEEAIAGVLSEMGQAFERQECDVLVGATADAKFGQCVTAILEGKRLGAALEQELLQRLPQKLTRFQLPKRIHYIEKFVRTSSGKVDRTATMKLIADHQDISS